MSRCACQTHEPVYRSGSVKDEIIYARVPGTLREALEDERRRMSAAAGAEVKTSAAIRALLEEALREKKRRAARRVARSRQGVAA